MAIAASGLLQMLLLLLVAGITGSAITSDGPACKCLEGCWHLAEWRHII